MTKRMLVDATHAEETRVAIVDGHRLVEFDYESKYRKPLKGSIFLAKVTRVEPSLQAAFVNFGGNRHGFLPFSEIHPDYFRIPIADREALLAEQAAMQADEDEEDAEDSQQGPEGADDAATHEDESGDAQHDEDYVIEEIGGDLGPVAVEPESEDADDEVALQHRDMDQPKGDAHEESADVQGDDFLRGQDQDNLSFSSGDAGNVDASENRALSGSADGDEAELSGEQADQNSESGEPGEQRRGGQHTRGRGRGRHGNGGRGKHRMAYNSRRTESFGGTDEYSQEDRFRYNLRRKYKIQEVIKRGQIMLVQVSKEERGNKGAAVSTYLSLPGRYCVLMPNSPRGGGVSRKIANYEERARMRDILKDLTVPQGMSVIVRTAGVSRTKPEVKRDLDYLVKLWNTIRELTLQSSAPAMVYEEADLIKRAIRDLYDRDIEEVVVAGEDGFKTARNFMKMMIPTHVKKVAEYTDETVPLFSRHQVEDQISEIGETRVNLPSGGYLIINPTEALVSVDVNSGKATKERHIEETAVKTNLEAASELARQLRLRDLGGLIVIDFIDMEDRRNNGKVERRMRESLATDRARLQMGRISSFGLMELSRQRLNPSLTESQFEKCTHCDGMGRVRTSDATSIMLLRAIEEHGVKKQAAQIVAHVSADVALYVLNYKRETLAKIESRHGLKVFIRVDDSVGVSNYRLDVMKPSAVSDDDEDEQDQPAQQMREPREPRESRESRETRGEHRQPREREQQGSEEYRRSDRTERGEAGPEGEKSSRRRGRRGGRRRNGQRRDENSPLHAQGEGSSADLSGQNEQPDMPEHDDFPMPDHNEDSNGNLPRGESRPPRDSNRGRNRNKSRDRDSSNRRPREESNQRPQDSGSEGQAKPAARRADSTEQSQVQEQPPAAPSAMVRKPAIPKRQKPSAPPETKEYEQVNEEPGEKKRGWWNRLVEN